MHDSRNLVTVLAAVLLCLPSLVGGQTIRVVKRPPSRLANVDEFVQYASWTVSFSRKHAPNVYELDGGYRTLGAARARAQRLIEWSNSMEGGSDWKLAVILIEGDPSFVKLPSGNSQTNDPFDRILAEGKRQQDEILAHNAEAMGLDAPGSDAEGSDEVGLDVEGIELPDLPLLAIPGDLRTERDPLVPGSVVNEYKNVVETSWKNTGILKDKLESFVGSMTDRQLEKAKTIASQMTGNESSLFIEQTNLRTVRIEMDDEAARLNQEDRKVYELMERIARTADPQEQKRLIEQMGAIEQLAKNIEENASLKQQQDDYESRRENVATLEGIVAEGKKQQTEILEQFAKLERERAKPEKKWVDPKPITPRNQLANTKWTGTGKLSTGETVGTLTIWLDDGGRFRMHVTTAGGSHDARGTWVARGNSVELRGEGSAESQVYSINGKRMSTVSHSIPGTPLHFQLTKQQ